MELSRKTSLLLGIPAQSDYLGENRQTVGVLEMQNERTHNKEQVARFPVLRYENTPRLSYYPGAFPFVTGT